jgi:hypothetical protein
MRYRRIKAGNSTNVGKQLMHDMRNSAEIGIMKMNPNKSCN